MGAFYEWWLGLFMQQFSWAHSFVQALKFLNNYFLLGVNTTLESKELEFGNNASGGAIVEFVQPSGNLLRMLKIREITREFPFIPL